MTNIDDSSKPETIPSPLQITGMWLILSLIGQFAGTFLTNLLPLNTIPFLPTLIVGGSLAGFQWILLRRFIPQPGPWLIAATIAYFLANFTIAILSPSINDYNFFQDKQFLAGIIIEIIIGLIYGLGQWLILRPYLRYSLLWIAATITGWILNLSVINFIHLDSDNIIILITFGLVLRLIQYLPTSFALAYLLHPELLNPPDTTPTPTFSN